MHQADTEDWIWFVRFDVRNTAKRQMIGLFDKFGNHPYVHVLVNNGILSSIPNCMISVQMYVIFIFFLLLKLSELCWLLAHLYTNAAFSTLIIRSISLINGLKTCIIYQPFYLCSHLINFIIINAHVVLVILFYQPFTIFIYLLLSFLPFAVFVYLLPSISTFCLFILPFAVFIYLLPSLSTFCRQYLSFAVFIYLFPSLSTFCH